MESVLYVVFGADGHRQRESFNRSWSFGTERAAVEIFNIDRTGSNLYTLIQITAVYLHESIYFNGLAEACRNYSKHAEDLQDLQDQLRADADGMTYPELSYLD